MRDAEWTHSRAGQTADAFVLIHLRDRPANVERMLRENRDRATRRGERVRDGLFDELGIVRHARNENTFFHKVHRAHLQVRFHEKALGRKRHVQSLGQFLGPIRRHDGRADHDQVGMQDQFLVQD